ncbi:MAG: hypothetical protein J5865_08655 [Lachnospiraceae bacterium]|nr:hypothetical protein [Lachnospiraceae bacterium]
MKNKTVNRLLAALLSFGLLLTGCAGASVDPGRQLAEGTTEAIKPAETAAPTEAQTAAPTEAQTQAPTEQESSTVPLPTGENKVLMNGEIPAGKNDNAGSSAGFSDGLMSPEAALAFLTGDNRNHVYSPLNVTMALAMLAEITEGETRAEVLKLMGVESIEALRKKVEVVLKTAYYDTEQGTSLIADSIWLRNDYTGYNMETLRTLANRYAASSFEGTMGSDEYNRMIQTWLDENTKGLLTDQANGIEFDPMTIIALASTLYYKVNWSEPFFEEGTQDKIFHSPTGDVTVPFMRQSTHGYYRGEHFGAIRLYMTDGNYFWLFLPDEGYTLEDVAGSEDYLAIIRGEREDEAENVQVNFEFPKLDVLSDMDIVRILSQLGLTKVFDSAEADFSPLYENEQLPTWVSEIHHAARVTADENGVEAAAFTVIMVKANGFFMGEPIEFICDRPFIFTIANPDGLVWFSGSVNQP